MGTDTTSPVSFVRELLANKKKSNSPTADVSTWEKLGNRESSRPEAEDKIFNEATSAQENSLFPPKKATGGKRAINIAYQNGAEDDFKEEDHPRGQPGNAGQFGSGNGGSNSNQSLKDKDPRSNQPTTEKESGTHDFKPGIVARGLIEAEKKKKEWATNSPIKSIDDLVSRSQNNQDALAAVAQTIENETGLEFSNPGVKSEDRLKDKVIRDGKPPGRINDAVRGGFTVETPEQADKVVAELAKHFETVDEGWYVTPTNYFDRKVLVRFKDGQVGEVQLWHPKMLEVKHQGGHKLYVEWQNLPQNDPRKADLARKQVELYSQTLQSLPQEWKALFGKGTPGNNSLNSDSLTFRALRPTSMVSAGIQAPLRKTRAPSGFQNAGSLSHVQRHVSSGISSPLAFDRALVHVFPRGLNLRAKRDGMAFDVKSVRRFTPDGHLHVEITNISKATINPYLGHEIPGWQQLGLDPDKIYNLLRDPDELRKAASTFNNVPLLSKHVPVSSDAHPSQDVIGSTGTDANFQMPYLRNSLVIWTEDAIRDIEAETKRELSSAYRYDPDMTPGTFQGQSYDGVMRNIVGNHVALVKEGRAGPDVLVQDSKENIIMATKATMSRQAAMVILGLSASLRPKLAADTKLDLRPLVRGVTEKNYKSRKPAILAELRKSIKLRPILAADGKPVSKKLAMDATIGEVAELLDMIEAHGVQPGMPGALPNQQMAAVDPAAQITGAPGNDPAPAPMPMGAGASPEPDAGAGMAPQAPGEGVEPGEESQGGDPAAQIQTLLAGKVDDATLQQIMQLIGPEESNEEVPPPDETEGEEEEESSESEDKEPDMAQGGEGKLKELGAKDKLLEEDPNAEKGTGTGEGSPGAGSGSAEDEEFDEDKEAEDEMEMAGDNPPSFKGMPKPGGKMAGDRKVVTVDTMNKAVRIAVQAERKNQRQIQEATQFVRPWVGEVTIAADSANDVYKAALNALNVEGVDKIDPSAYRTILQYHPLPGTRQKTGATARVMASDEKSMKSYAERFPNAARIRHM